MRRHRLAAALLLAAAALLLAPAAGSAQVSIGAPYYAGGPQPGRLQLLPLRPNHSVLARRLLVHAALLLVRQ